MKKLLTETKVMRRISFIWVLLFLLLGSQRAFAYSGSGTAEDPYLIKSVSDWYGLCTDSGKGNSFAGKHIKMMADISVPDGKDPLGRDYAFRGTFDGDGHTLNYIRGIQSTGTNVLEPSAPFRYVGNGAVIKNLHVTGYLHSYKRYMGGVVGSAEGTVTIRNCWVTMEIETYGGGDRNYYDSYNGGLVGLTKSGSNVSITNCRFDGTMKGKEWADYSGGLVGKAEGDLTLINCLFNPSGVDITVNHCATLARVENSGTLTITNCYYTQTMGTPQGVATSGMAMDALTDKLGVQWMIRESQVIPFMLDITPFEGSGTQDKPYKIGSTENWYYLIYTMNKAEDSYADKYFKLVGDVYVDKMAGGYMGSNEGTQVPFAGILDGDGKKLRLGLSGSGTHIAPFSCLGNATIKNLTLSGKVSTSGQRPAAIAGFVQGDAIIENCKNSVSISSSYDQNVDAGAFVGGVNADAKLTIRGCSLEGTISYNSGYEGGGFVGFAQAGAHVTVEDCVFGMVTLLAKGKPESSVPSEQLYVFVGGSDAATVNITNCYYMPSFLLSPAINNGSVKAQGVRQYYISGGNGVTVKLDGTETTYNVSGITAYSENPGIKYGSQLWGADNSDVKLLLSKGELVASYTTNHGTLSGTAYSSTDNPYTLNVELGTLSSESFYVVISYNGLLYLLDSDSSADIIEKENGKQHTVVLGRTFKGGEWNSFSAPFAITESMVKSVFGNKVSVRELTASSYTNGALRLDFSTVTSIEAGKAYLIKPVSDVVEPRFESVTINKNTYPIQTTVADFIPAINPVSFTARDKTILFFTSDGTLSFPSDEGPMKGFRGYLQLKGAAAGQ